jgi:uncharacterized membrane protein YgcG
VRRTLLIVILALAAAPSFAKSLYWQSLNVEAHLGKDGFLRTVERQTMVFDGDWNGGERTFRLPMGQNVTLNGIARVDDSGRAIPLVKGDLSQVDHYDFTSPTVLRWRSRLPSDPPFGNRQIVYALDYTLTNVLRKIGENQYRLDHDFAFPDRQGAINKFTLDLTFDPEWNEPPIHIERENLPPGQSAVVTRDLTYQGTGAPSAFVPIPGWVGPVTAAVFIVVALLLVALFWRSEVPTGRFAPAIAPEQIDEQWLRTHLLSMKPEVAGAAWDASTGAPEVAAVLARLTSEGKITSRVDKKTLHLHLNQPLDQFSGYEGALLKGLFFDGQDTDTTRIKNYYKDRGFDPTKLISSGIESQLSHLPARSKRVKRFDWRIILGILAVVAVVAVIAQRRSPADLIAVAAASGVIIFFCLIAGVVANVHSSSLTGVGWRLLLVAVIFVPAFGTVFVCCLFAERITIGAFTVAGIALLAIACWKAVLDAFKITDTPAYIAFRKQLVGARNYFITQLRSEQPRLHDDWLPYLLAFGLGANVDSWFKSFGGRTGAGTSSFGSSSHSSSGSSPSSAPAWTGGGGAFGGAGATGSWALAAGALAAGVAAPSSRGSGGGGGGGGGGSSGGGGGGGW